MHGRETFVTTLYLDGRFINAKVSSYFSRTGTASPNAQKSPKALIIKAESYEEVSQTHQSRSRVLSL